MNDLTPTELGGFAFYDGKRIEDNPFEFGTYEYFAWQKEWNSGCADAMVFAEIQLEEAGR